MEKMTARVERDNERKRMSAMASQAVNAELSKMMQEQEGMRTQLLQVQGKISAYEKELKINTITKRELPDASVVPAVAAKRSKGGGS